MITSSLPASWRMVSLKDVAANKPNAIVDGPFGSNLKSSDYVASGIPVLQGKNITNDTFKWFDVRYISEKKAEELKRSSVRENDILVVKIGSIGYSAIVDSLSGHDFAIIPANLVKVSPNTDLICIKYLHHWLTSPVAKRYLISNASKTAQPALSLGKIKELPLPLPPLPEQHRIVAILDQADALRAKRQEALAQLDSLTQSIFIEMFGDPTPSGSRWPVRSLGDVCAKISDGTHHSPPIQDKGVPYITAKHLKEYGLDFFADPWFVSQNDHEQIYSRCDPKIDDVLYIKDGATTGIAAVNKYDFEFSMLSSLALLRPDRDELHPLYLCHWLNHPMVKTELLGAMAGAAIRRLTLAKIKAIRIPIPPIHRQEEFSKTVAQLEGVREKHSMSMTELGALFSSLQHRAFQGAL